MADQEVIKHTKKLYKIWNSREHSIWHKIKEFLIEIFIIVFAVSLSIWLHERSEHSHQQAVVKEFLLSLRNDLKKDLQQMSQDKKECIASQRSYAYLVRAGSDNKLERDSLNIYKKGIFILLEFVPNDGRYEGFKFSGNLGYIENLNLQNSIVDYYQESVKTLSITSKSYFGFKEKFFDFYMNNFKSDKKQTNIIPLLTSDVAQNYARTLVQMDELIGRYDVCLKNASQIVAEIDKEYQ